MTPSIKIHCAPNQNAKVRMENPKNAHEMLRFLLITGKIFGIFPIQNICSSDVKDLRFSWFSITTLLSVTTLIGGVITILAQLRKLFLEGYDEFDANAAAFTISGTFSCAFFIIISKNWRYYMEQWVQVEESTCIYEKSKTLNLKIKIIATTFLSLEAIEHIIIQTTKFVAAYNCKRSLLPAIEQYSVNMSFKAEFEIFNYSPWITLLLQITNTRLAFVWTYVDLFIVLISVLLTDKFQMLEKRVNKMSKMGVNSDASWRDTREIYLKIRYLCYLTNEYLGNMILLSFGTNMYFVITKLFDSIRETGTTLVYIYIDIFLLTLRITAICYFCGSVYEEAAKPLDTLIRMPESDNNVEIKRFIQCASDPISITGKEFFEVRKGLTMKMATAIVTYELILIQFNGKNLHRKTLDTKCY